MKPWTKYTLTGFGFLGAGLFSSIAIGTNRWTQRIAEGVEKLNQSASRTGFRRVSFEDFDDLPAPVARYFRFALKDGQPIIRAAKIVQSGEFNLNGKWIPFAATQHFSSSPPGMVWDANMRMIPLLNIRVCDAYLAGQGSMQAKILSLVPVVDEQGKEELNASALQRYLAEAVWLPTALLPSENLTWSAIDERRALATLTDSGLSTSLEFSFNEAGEITSVFTPGRYREVDGSYELASWAGHFRSYEDRDGMRIPIEGEVEWQLPAGNLPYWKGRIVKVEYEFAR